MRSITKKQFLSSACQSNHREYEFLLNFTAQSIENAAAAITFTTY